MRIRITELQTQSGLSDKEFAELLWPEAKTKQSRRVLLARAKQNGSVYISLVALRNLRDKFATTNINNLIDFEDEATTELP